MKITERRLRSIIRQIIKESAINEMFDMHNPYDSMVGAAAHGEVWAQKVNNYVEVENKLRKIHAQDKLPSALASYSVYVAGLIGLAKTGTLALVAGALTGKIALAVTLTGAVIIIIKALKARNDKLGNERTFDKEFDKLRNQYFDFINKKGSVYKAYPELEDLSPRQAEQEGFVLYLEREANFKGFKSILGPNDAKYYSV